MQRCFVTTLQWRARIGHKLFWRISASKRGISQRARPDSFSKDTKLAGKLDPNIPEILRIYSVNRLTAGFLGMVKLVPLVVGATNATLWACNSFGLIEYSIDFQRLCYSAIGVLLTIANIAYSAPFVCIIQMTLPAAARLSREALTRFATKSPKDTRLAFTTVAWYGFPRTTAVKLGDLRPCPRKPLQLENIVWKAPEKAPAARWWAQDWQTRFYVGTLRTRTFESTIWDKVFQQIKSQTRNP